MRQSDLTPTSDQYLAQRSASLKFWAYFGIAGMAVANVGLYALRCFS